MSNKAKDLGIVAIGITGMFLVYWIYSIFLADYLPLSDDLKTVIGKVIFLVFGLGVFLIATKKMENIAIPKNKVSAKTLLICFLLQFTALMFTMILLFMNIALTTAFGGKDSSTDISALSPLTLILLLVINPILEESIFRHLLAKKLLKHGERFYIFVSAYCFAIAHGVSLGVIQIGYTFILGMIYSFLMVKTGNIVLVIILHSLSNLFGGVIFQTLSNVSVGVAAVYLLLVMVLGIIGLILFLINRRNIILDGSQGLVEKHTFKDLATNKGVILYSAITFIMILLK